MDHPDHTKGIKRLPADSPALAGLRAAQTPELRYPRGFAPNATQRAHGKRLAERRHATVQGDDLDLEVYDALSATYESATIFKAAPYDASDENFRKIVDHGMDALPYLVADMLVLDQPTRWQTAAVWFIALEAGLVVSDREQELSVDERKAAAIHWVVSQMLE